MEIHRSARRHGFGDATILHAVANAVTIVDLEPDADPPKVLAIGPDPAGNLPEVIWIDLEGGVEPVIHASGRTLTDTEVEALAAEVEQAGYDVEALKARRRGRPPMGSGPADVVPVRMDPELRAAIEARATADQTTASDIIRQALRKFLDVA